MTEGRFLGLLLVVVNALALSADHAPLWKFCLGEVGLLAIVLAVTGKKR